ncbi:hypothetical protein [Deinococcus sp. UYEF24]
MPLADPLLGEVKVHAGQDAFTFHQALPSSSQLDLDAAYAVYANTRLVAAALLDVVSTAAGEIGFGNGIKKFKQDGDVEVEFFQGTSAGIKARDWAARAARLRMEVLRGSSNFATPLVGIVIGNDPTPTFVRTVNPDPVQVPSGYFPDPERDW